MTSVYFYTVEDIRHQFIEQMTTHGSIIGACIKIGITQQRYYNIKSRVVPVPPCIYRQVGLQKVVDGPTTVGYVSKGDIEWERLWI